MSDPGSALPLHCSGGAYPPVPMAVFLVSRSFCIAFAMPKSTRITRPSLFNIILAGFMSRYIIGGSWFFR